MIIIFLFLSFFEIYLACNDLCWNKTINENQNCFCSECELYGDCCLDKASKNSILPETYACNSYLKDYGEIYTIGKCAFWYSNKNITLKCVSEPAAIIQTIPVYSHTKKLFFKNIFCALCNLKITEIKNLKMFPIETKIEYSSMLLDYKISQPWYRYNVLKPDDTPWPRKCIKNVETCPHNFNDTQILHFCSNHTAYRFSLSGKVYKNQYCAKCNEIDPILLCSKGSGSGFIEFMSLQVLFDLKNLKDDIIIKMNATNKNDKTTYENMTIIKINEELDLVKKYMTIVGQSVSIVCLIILIVFYIIKKNNQKLPGKILISLSISLIFSHLSFIIGSILSVKDQILNVNYTYKSIIEMLQDLLPILPCYISGFCLHYFYLSFFLWTNIMAIDLFKLFNNLHKFSNYRIFLKYSIYGWLVPLIIVLIMNLKNYNRISYGFQNCFISSSFDLLIFFVIPVSLIIILNLILMTISIKLILKVDLDIKKFMKENEHLKEQRRYRFVLFFKLFSITGVSWILAIVCSILDERYSFIWYIYIFVNSFQGFIIMCIFVLNDIY